MIPLKFTVLLPSKIVNFVCQLLGNQLYMFPQLLTKLVVLPELIEGHPDLVMMRRMKRNLSA